MLADEFWSQVDKSGDCWLWTGVTTPKGYGRYWDGKRHQYAHRLVYEEQVGAIPEGVQLDHRVTCPKNCVRPQHLRHATSKQNNENRAGVSAASGVRGVTWIPKLGKWRARVKHHRRTIHIGLFDTIDEAEAAAVAKRLELFTHNDLDRRANA